MALLRVSSGISALDATISGGFPRGAVVGYLGKTGVGKSVAGWNFISHSVQNNLSALVITTTQTAEKYKELALEKNLDLSQATFVDAAFWRIKRIKPNIQNNLEFSVSNLTDLNGLLAVIIKACKEKSIDVIFFDTPSSLLLYTTPGHEQVFKFIELLGSYTRSNQITLVYTLERLVHPEFVTSTLSFLSDGLIHFRLKEEDHIIELQTNFMISTDISQSWVEFKRD